MLQSKRDADVTVRQSSEIERIRDFLEKGLERTLEPGTLQTVPADTKERKIVTRVGRGQTLKEWLSV